MSCACAADLSGSEVIPLAQLRWRSMGPCSTRRFAMNSRMQQQILARPHGYDDVEAQTMAQISFGPFRLVPYARRLECQGVPSRIGGRAFDLLCLLVSRPGQVVSKSELIARTWPDLTVEETSLRFHIAQLRRVLGGRQGSERYIVNVPGRGYCFVARVTHDVLPLQQRLGRDTSEPVPCGPTTVFFTGTASRNGSLSSNFPVPREPAGKLASKSDALRAAIG
jgi:DNA-binding winged helix-turn-helix (wHTH) protein